MKSGLKEMFRNWLTSMHLYSAEEVSALLDGEWDGALPSSFLFDDLMQEIKEFLYNVALFCLERVVGGLRSYEYDIVVSPSYEDLSKIVIYEEETRTVVATWAEKTWHFAPEDWDQLLAELCHQIKEGIKLAKKREEEEDG